MFGIDPLLSTAIIAGGIFIVSYMIGLRHGRALTAVTNEQIISATIDHLIEDGYLCSVKDAQGEDMLVKIVDISK